METNEMIARLEYLGLGEATRTALLANPDDLKAREHALLLIAMFDDCHDYLEELE